MNIFLSFCFSLSFFTAKSNKLIVNIQGLSDEKGNIRCALYRAKDKFLDDKITFKNKIVSAKNTQLIFENLHSDRYALAIFQDENKNGILDKNIFGVPTEKYGFSNNVRGVFSAPSFNEAAIHLKEDKVISVYLK